MNWNKRLWLSIALVNLAIVAMLGTILRSKILFSIPFLDFKYILHAHSHYAFSGWVTLALLVLMTYEILPKQLSVKPIYQLLFGCMLVNAVGMLVSFPLQGYGFYSILFSTLFIFTTYAFTWIFIKHLLQSRACKPVQLLSIFSMIYLVLSSAGPFTLAYLLATKSANAVLYRDAIYSYLHLQYSGFFALAVFALLFNRIENTFSGKTGKNVMIFSQLLTFSVVPSMFLCYLWHYPNPVYRIIALFGSISLFISVGWLLFIFYKENDMLRHFGKTARRIVVIALAAFITKMLLQSLTIIHSLGAMVFSNRPVIIAFLHLVLLGFVTLYILAHFIQAGLFRQLPVTGFAVNLFAAGVIMNELILFTQGVDIMMMHNSVVYPWLLWATALCLFVGSVLLLVARYKSSVAKDAGRIKNNLTEETTKSFFNFNNESI